MIFSNSWHSRQLARCVMAHGPVLCGSDSESSTTNKTEVKDMRVVGGDGSVNVSADGGSSIAVMSTDHGAVAGGLQLGSQAVDAVVKSGQQLQSTTLSLYDGALKNARDSSQIVADVARTSTQQVADAYSKVATDLATAFTDSKAPDKSMLMVGGVVVVGLAAVMIFAKKG